MIKWERLELQRGRDGGKVDGVMSAEGVRICLGQASLGNRAREGESAVEREVF